MLVAVIPVLIAVADGIFFGGGSGGCCCGCGTPQPPSCGCQCPVPAPCPACPQNYCPPPPVAYCPQVQPVYLPACTGVETACSPGYAAGGAYPQAGLNRGGAGDAGYGAPHPPFSETFPSGGGYAGGGNVEQPYSSGGGNIRTGAELGLQQQADPPSYNPQHNVAHMGSSPSNYAPPLNNQRLPESMCDEAKVKYVVLRTKKGPGSGTEEVMEEAEEVNQTSPIDATASPLDTQEVIDDISRNEVTHDDTEHDSRFTYLVSTTEHCEAQKDSVICFVYKRPLLR